MRPTSDIPCRSRPPPAPSPADRGWTHWLESCRDLAELKASHPMVDAVIDEIDGRMIRVGDQWLADFASCNYLGFDLDREIIDASRPTSTRGARTRAGRACSAARCSTSRSRTG